MTRLLLVANWLDDLGGVQTATRSLASALGAAGVQVRLVSAFAPTESGARSDAPVLFPVTPWRAAPERLRAVLADTRWGRIDRFGRARAVRRLEALARGVDAVIAMDVFSSEVVAAAHLPHARRYVQYHNTFRNIDGTRDLDRVLRASSVLDGIVALTDADADGFRTRTSLPVHAIPNALPMSAPRASRQDRLVVGLGRYTPTKNFALLLDAWAHLPEAQRDGWRVELHGDGPERGALERLAGPDVAVLGPTTDPAGVLDRAAVLVLPSQHEGLPMVLLEAMAASVVCVATRSSPGVEELLGEGAGWLVPVGDREALGRSMVEAMSDPEQRAARTHEAQGRLSRYSSESVAAQWLEVLSAGRRAA